MCLLQVNPLTVLGMVEVSAVPEGKYLLQGAAGSVLGRMVRLPCRSLSHTTQRPVMPLPGRSHCMCATAAGPGTPGLAAPSAWLSDIAEILLS